MPEQHAKVLGESEILERVSKQLPGWEYRDKKIFKKYEFKGNTRAKLFISGIGYIEDKMNHHAEISITDYRYVTIELFTHIAGGVTVKDFELAKKIEVFYGM